MHMADALVSPIVGGTMLAISVGTIAYSVYQVTKKEDEKKTPMMGVMGAFVFAAQMINFTIPGTGSSGHIGGGILLASLLGPFPAFLTITAVLIIQALFFADGGILALGCNIFNMGFLSCFVAFPLLFRPLVRKKMSSARISLASLMAVVIGLQLGAFSVVLETEFSHITSLPFLTFLLLMQPIHLAIGCVEGIITALILNFILAANKELLVANVENKSWVHLSVKRIAVIMVSCAVVIGGAFSLGASSRPDGLEWSIQNITGNTEVTQEYSAQKAAQAIQNKMAVMPDYQRKHTQGNSKGDTSLSGILGGGITLLFAGGIGWVITHIKRKKHV